MDLVQFVAPWAWACSAAAFFGAVYLVSRIRVVPRTQILVVEHMGNVTRTLSNTIAFLWPLEREREFWWSWDGTQPSRRVALPLTEQSLDPPSLEVRARSYPCEVDILVRYRITDAARAAETSDDPLRATMVTITSRLREACSQRSWSEIDKSRASLAAELVESLNTITEARYGITISEVVIEGVSVNKAVAKSFQAQFQKDAELEAEMRNTQRRRELALYEEETKTRLQEAELERARSRNVLEAEKLRVLADAGVDLSTYFMAQSYAKLAEAVAAGQVHTLVLGANGLPHLAPNQ
ncbi:uncharacterized protein AMSG_04887 [Thecamonas trahens ATCC 50062]|uniref:Band 7 domain-containing protein n=1 Tax=Thecamonas trahens ATCC 50062 TaxID=461836 RepID=A0A0L0D8N1_THETB|nr:hypothetical protein AMSG_04887 [Thecamonas trahens ATCC 50062]KNC48441.1 hypothetical protein AMSG_04887 [Thecamonas trahens ATCC 50062]|eukprot:XP_013758554.1 hypothetical protein AMSG_04887 [Thecamonas trahens ATCC 50062]